MYAHATTIVCLCAPIVLTNSKFQTKSNRSIQFSCHWHMKNLFFEIACFFLRFAHVNVKKERRKQKQKQHKAKQIQ